MPFEGSSPRVRGKHRRPHRRHQIDGLIPACAVKTPCPTRKIFPARAHPRVCGENLAVKEAWGHGDGSSPRVRGKLSLQAFFPLRGRLIPACAGKTRDASRFPHTQRAHPRVCGENRRFARSVITCWGSSPRVRGKRENSGNNVNNTRLIPACAGKTFPHTSPVEREKAHPRVCGENTERSGVLTLRSVRSWKTLSFPSSLKATHCRTFMQLWLSRIRL